MSSSPVASQWKQHSFLVLLFSEFSFFWFLAFEDSRVFLLQNSEDSEIPRKYANTPYLSTWSYIGWILLVHFSASSRSVFRLFRLFRHRKRILLGHLLEKRKILKASKPASKASQTSQRVKTWNINSWPYLKRNDIVCCTFQVVNFSEFVFFCIRVFEGSKGG